MEIYLDNSATTRVSAAALQAMEDALLTTYGNPSSPHRKGLEAERLVKSAKETISSALGVNPATIIFTSGGTEANNWAVWGAVQSAGRTPVHVITTAVEHSSVLEPVRRLEQQGHEVTILPVDQHGRVSPDDVIREVRPNTVLVSVMYVNNEIGTIQPVAAIGRALEQLRRGLPRPTRFPLFHVDAVQALGKVELSPVAIGADLVSISAHKIHGPKGSGALYIREGLQLPPLLLGGDQESGLRPGTENVPGIAGFAAAVREAVPRQTENAKKLRALRQRLVGLLREKFPDARINGPADDNDVAPHIASVSFAGIKGETLVHALADKGIYTGTGSACHSRRRIVSHVIQAIKAPARYQEGTIRISMSPETTTEQHIDALVAALAEIVPALQALTSLRER